MCNFTFSFVFFSSLYCFDDVGVHQSYLLVLRFTYIRAGLWVGVGFNADVKGDLVSVKAYDGFCTVKR